MRLWMDRPGGVARTRARAHARTGHGTFYHPTLISFLNFRLIAFKIYFNRAAPYVYGTRRTLIASIYALRAVPANDLGHAACNAAEGSVRGSVRET